MSLELILASGSPQRQALLRDAGYCFTVVPPRTGAECGVCSRETPPEFVARLAWQKAADIVMRQGAASPGRLHAPLASSSSLKPQASSLVVSCDTVAECLGQILGKPTCRDHARSMLRLLSGREHHVYSGLCLWPLPAGEPSVRVDTTTLRMDPLSDDQIAEYLDSGLWEGKAGAFGYQDRAGWLHIVSGSESNVIGLPLELLADMLAEFEAGSQQGDHR